MQLARLLLAGGGGTSTATAGELMRCLSHFQATRLAQAATGLQGATTHLFDVDQVGGQPAS